MTEVDEIRNLKNQFRDLLPYGFTSKIKDRLKKDFGRELSHGKVSQVCNPDKPDWDNDVIKIAMDLAADEKKKLDEKKRILNHSKPAHAL